MIVATPNKSHDRSARMELQKTFWVGIACCGDQPLWRILVAELSIGDTSGLAKTSAKQLNHRINHYPSILT